MKTQTSLKKLSLWLIAAVVAIVVGKAPAQAASTQGVDIHVSINASKALTIAATFYNYGQLNVNTSSVSATSLLVTNTSGGIQETYTMQGANATGGSGWTLNSSTGTLDNYVLGAMFSTAAPANTDAIWSTSLTTTTVTACATSVYGNGTLAQSGASVSPVGGSNTRNLWFRMITPLLVTDPTQKDITLTVAVQ